MESHSGRRCIWLPETKLTWSLSHCLGLCRSMIWLHRSKADRNVRSSHQTGPTLSPRHGTKHCAYGNSLQEPQLDDSSATLMMSSPSPFPPTIDKSSQDLVIRQSSSGTPWETANSRYKRKYTRIGSHAYDSVPTLRIRSLLVLGGISLSRYV